MDYGAEFQFFLWRKQKTWQGVAVLGARVYEKGHYS
jgi:hypothetical protein